MTGAARLVTYAGFAVMALFGLLFGLFAAGYALDDPGGWAGAGLTALWFVPAIALSVFAFRRPASAVPAFVAGTAAVSILTIIDSTFGVIPRDDWGPVLAITVGAAGVIVAFLGLHRPKIAGTLLLVLGAAQLVATVIPFVGEAEGEGPGFGGALTTSSGVVVLPILVSGLLFLTAGTLIHESLRVPPTTAG